MTSSSREIRLFNAKRGYFYVHLMVCRIFKGQHHGSKKRNSEELSQISLFIMESLLFVYALLEAACL